MFCFCSLSSSPAVPFTVFISTMRVSACCFTEGEVLKNLLGYLPSSFQSVLPSCFFFVSISSCSLIFHPGDSLCCSKWFASLISLLLVTLALSFCVSLTLHFCINLPHSLIVSQFPWLWTSVSLSLWRLGNTFPVQTAWSDLLAGSASGGWLVSSSAPPPLLHQWQRFPRAKQQWLAARMCLLCKKHCRCCTLVQMAARCSSFQLKRIWRAAVPDSANVELEVLSPHSYQHDYNF